MHNICCEVVQIVNNETFGSHKRWKRIILNPWTYLWNGITISAWKLAYKLLFGSSMILLVLRGNYSLIFLNSNFKGEWDGVVVFFKIIKNVLWKSLNFFGRNRREGRNKEGITLLKDCASLAKLVMDLHVYDRFSG